MVQQIIDQFRVIELRNCVCTALFVCFRAVICVFPSPRVCQSISSAVDRTGEASANEPTHGEIRTMQLRLVNCCRRGCHSRLV